MNKFMPFLVGVFLAFPLFFTKDFRIFSGGLGSYEFSLPVSVFASAVCVALNIHYVIAAISRVAPLLFFLGVLSIVMTALVLLWGSDPSLLAVYVIPALLGFFLPWAIRLKNVEDIASLFYGFVASMGLVAALHLLASFYEFGVVGAFVERGVDSIFGLFSIYQKFIYYSTLLAIACFFVLIHVGGPAKYFLLFVLAADLVLIGAREALLLFAFFLVATGLVVKKNSLLGVIYLYMYSGLGVLSFLFLYWMGQTYFPEVAIVAKLGTSFGADGGDMSAGRIDAIYNVASSFDIDFIFFVFGSGFSTVEGELGTPHNQYVEWFLRGGLVFLLFNLFFLAVAAAYALRSRHAHLVSIGVVLFSVVVFSNNINTPFRAPYASVFLWCLIGVVFRFASLKVWKRASDIYAY